MRQRFGITSYMRSGFWQSASCCALSTCPSCAGQRPWCSSESFCSAEVCTCSHSVPRTCWGSFVEVADRSERELHEIAEALPVDAPRGSTEQKAGDFYRAYLDTNTIESRGLAAAQPGLQAIAAARTHEQLAELMGRPDLNLKAPLGVGITTDQKNPDRYIVVILQSGLSLPDRDYYLKNDLIFTNLRVL